MLKSVAAIAAASALSACGGTPAPAPTATKPPAAAASTPAPPKLESSGVLWGLQYDPHVAAYQRLVELFARRTGVTLKLEPQPSPQQKLVAALAADTQPDVCCIMGNQCTPLYVQKALLPLKDAVYMHSKLDPAKDFVGDGVECYMWQGEVYGVPTEFNRVGSVVNVPLDDLQKLGLDKQYPPTNGQTFFESYESMWELAKALQIKDGDTVVRWGLSANGWDSEQVLGIIRSLLAKRNMSWWDSANQKFNINTEEGIEAMRLHAEQPVKLGIEAHLDTNSVDSALAKKVALSKGNRTPTIQGKAIGVNYDLAGSPKINNELPLFVGEGGWGFVALKKAKSPNVALEFLRMMLTVDGQMEYCRIYDGSPSPLKTMATSRAYFTDPKDTSPQVKAARILLDHLGPRTQYYGSDCGYLSELKTIAADVSSRVRLGKLTPKDAMAEWQQRAEKQHKQFLEDMKG